MVYLGKEIYFPSPDSADWNGMLAVGGDLSVERLMLAYKKGIFPWYNPQEPILWWCPDPRCLIFVDQIKISKSMRQVLRANKFKVTFDTAFEAVMRGCQNIYRPKQGGTWITREFIDSYVKLHEMGVAHSVEVWRGSELVGGLYGESIGHSFCGESMFAKETNASKYGLIMMARNLEEQGFDFIDCQIHTPHLESLGAIMLPRKKYLKRLSIHAKEGIDKRPWHSYFRDNFTF